MRRHVWVTACQERNKPNSDFKRSYGPKNCKNRINIFFEFEKCVARGKAKVGAALFTRLFGFISIPFYLNSRLALRARRYISCRYEGMADRSLRSLNCGSFFSFLAFIFFPGSNQKSLYTFLVLRDPERGLIINFGRVGCHLKVDSRFTFTVRFSIAKRNPIFRKPRFWNPEAEKLEIQSQKTGVQIWPLKGRNWKGGIRKVNFTSFRVLSVWGLLNHVCSDLDGPRLTDLDGATSVQVDDEANKDPTPATGEDLCDYSKVSNRRRQKCWIFMSLCRKTCGITRFSDHETRWHNYSAPLTRCYCSGRGWRGCGKWRCWRAGYSATHWGKPCRATASPTSPARVH